IKSKFDIYDLMKIIERLQTLTLSEFSESSSSLLFFFFRSVSSSDSSIKLKLGCKLLGN
ncbi:15419_t:CDS:1, partial [Funneliformis caledonium]